MDIHSPIATEAGMRIFVTGGSGFVGRAVIDQLLQQGHEVSALMRKPRPELKRQGLTQISGDTTQAHSLDGALQGCDAVIHLVGIIREFPSRDITFSRLHIDSTRNLIEAAQQQGVSRFLHMSANGSRPDGVSAYHRSKWAAEELVRASDLQWTIFRPSLIFGPGDEFINMLAPMVKYSPLVPVFGDGDYLLQPAHVENIAQAFTRSLQLSASYGRSYSCCGPQALSYNQLLDLIGTSIGRPKVRKLHQPLGLIKPMISLLQGCPLFPITRDQLQMLVEGNTCSDQDWIADLDITLRPLDSISEYLG